MRMQRMEWKEGGEACSISEVRKQRKSIPPVFRRAANAKMWYNFFVVRFLPVTHALC
jgi:hypothetical protein